MKKKITSVLISAVYSAITASSLAVSAFADDAASEQRRHRQQFMLIRPQRKQEQELKSMQQSIEVGDEIVTRDGIIGMVVRIGKDSIVIETGGDRNKIRLKTWAVAENVTAKERAAANAPKKDNPLAAAGLSNEADSKKSKKKKDDSKE